jgi:hypothetical protein
VGLSDAITAVILIAALFIGLPVLILWLRDRVAGSRRARRNPPEKIAADRRGYEQRILRPDWEFYERHLQRPAPLALRELYADRKLVTAHGVRGERLRAAGRSLEMDASLDTHSFLDFDAVAIATNQFGTRFTCALVCPNPTVSMSRITTEMILKSSRNQSRRCLRD